MQQQGSRDTFCILPFKHMQISNTGFVRLCCQTPWITDGVGKSFNIYEHSAAEIWNSETMRGVRRDMIAGKPVEECAACWQQEVHGGRSRRMRENDMDQVVWRRVLNRLGVKRYVDPFKKIKAEAVHNDFTVRSGPVDLELEVGNICNLKCRMCTPLYSSKVEHDPVHSKWYDQKSPADYYPMSRLPGKKHWFKETAFVYGELLRHPKSIRHISFKGGEPFISKEALDIIDYLSIEGESHKLRISITTNGTVNDTALFKNASRLERVELSVSLDGTGKYYEYIRYPAKWEAIVDNLRRFSKRSNIFLTTSITFQMYNALQIVELFRFCDRFGYPINLSSLHYPPYLAASVMPPKARQLAAQRIRDYVETDCRKKYRANIGALARDLEAVGDGIDVDKLQKFMLFTNDLDQSRNQSFRDVHSELLGYIEVAGIHWCDETRFLA